MAILTGIVVFLNSDFPPSLIIEVLILVIAISIAAFPEGLPVVLITALSVGAHKMAKKNAIVNRMSIIETLGETTVICSDKTGTLTENQMTVQKIMAGGVEYEVTGAGYNPSAGKILQQGNSFDPGKYPALIECLRAGILCNDSQLLQSDKEWRVQGDPTEGALFVPAIKGGIDLAEQKNRFPPSRRLAI